jgi:hypothetical protein
MSCINHNFIRIIDTSRTECYKCTRCNDKLDTTTLLCSHKYIRYGIMDMMNYQINLFICIKCDHIKKSS